ncbi:hypothetical protein K474DRAFT_1677099 [Panus rudis PR-1116 ss-1]|nr:hypothetical protein K474DRAFT_1677099 [Panus rudis PR-1116 ss-1]
MIPRGCNSSKTRSSGGGHAMHPNGQAVSLDLEIFYGFDIYIESRVLSTENTSGEGLDRPVPVLGFRLGFGFGFGFGFGLWYLVGIIYIDICSNEWHIWPPSWFECPKAISILLGSWQISNKSVIKYPFMELGWEWEWEWEWAIGNGRRGMGIERGEA